jgi:purine nucleosidase
VERERGPGCRDAERRAAGLPPLPLALGLDVTERAKLLPDHLAALAARAEAPTARSRDAAIGAGADASGADGDASGADVFIPANPVIRFIDDALRFYMEFHSRYDGFYGAFVHDPFAVAAALDPSLVRTEALPVDVELDGTLTTGETVTDWRRAWGRPPTLDVAVEGDAAAFFERFIERVGGLAARVG